MENGGLCPLGGEMSARAGSCGNDVFFGGVQAVTDLLAFGTPWPMHGELRERASQELEAFYFGVVTLRRQESRVRKRDGGLS